MVDIDIPVSESLQKLLDIPECNVIALPMPKPLQVTLPTGGRMQALVDMSKAIPNDCSMNFNLMLQMAPLLAALECPMKILKLLKPLIDIIKSVSKLEAPPASAIGEFLDAVPPVMECFAALAAMGQFVKDLLCLIRSVLNCLLGQLRTVRNLMNGLQLRMGEAEGNPDLLNTLMCAQQNANKSMQSLTQAIDPIAGVLALVGTVAGIAGVSMDIQLVPPAAPPEDLAGLDAMIATLQGVVDAIDVATGGQCG